MDAFSAPKTPTDLYDTLREALLPVAGEGFVENEKNHGFCAVEHPEQTFWQALHLRLPLECEAAETALKQGDFDLEMVLNAAPHNPDYIEAQMETAKDVSPYLRRWSRLGWVFHSTLLGACNSDLLIRIHNSVYDAVVARCRPTCQDAIRAHLALYQNTNRPPERLAPKGGNET